MSNFILTAEFKVKCIDCPYRGKADNQHDAIELAKDHIQGDWRSATCEHTVKIQESLSVAKKEEDY